MKIFSRHLHI